MNEIWRNHVATANEGAPITAERLEILRQYVADRERQRLTFFELYGCTRAEYFGDNA